MLSPIQQRNLAHALRLLKESFLNNAELMLGRVLAEAPDDPTALRYLGLTLLKLGRTQEGLERLRQAARREPSPDAWSDLAVALQRSGESAGAAQAWAEATGRREPPPGDAAFSIERAQHDFRFLDYGYRAHVRYGEGRPPHPGLQALIDAGRDRYRTVLEGIGEAQADFAEVPLGGAYDSADPFWLNTWFPPLDAMALTQMLRAHAPARFLEVGSGVSTKYARRAVRLYGLKTRLTSIDPQPRQEIDALCDEVIRRPLEDCEPEMFEALEPGDIFFLDSSHRAFQGSDVTVFFLEILPRLKSGVIVHIHDIYLPEDYVSGHVPRLWNEQYLLAVMLLFGEAFEVLFPCWFVYRDAELMAAADKLIRRGPLAGLNLFGASFWLRKR